jgi:hypothetical protein
LDDGWYQTVRQAMEDAYRNACPHKTPRQIEAFACGRRFLRLKNPEKTGVASDG